MISEISKFRKIPDFICPFCGALCDDLIVETDGREIKVENACVVGTAKILSSVKYHKRVLKPYVDGREVNLEEALDKSAEILVKAKKPLFYGFSSTSCEAHEVAIELAEKLGGVIDCTSSVCHGPSILAIHEVGIPSYTLGEIKNRADLVIFWGCNPMHAHPRHMSRYSVFPKGRFSRSRIGRKVVVVDVRPTESSKLADMFIQVEPGKDYEVLNALRAIINSGDCRVKRVGGVEIEKLKELADMMKNCKFGIIFFGMGLTHSFGNYWNISEAISLVKDLYRFTKFGIMPMRGHYNVSGFNEVCTWETGYPFAVDFSRGYPWYNPGETDTNSILAKRDTDAMFVLGGDPAAHFPRATVNYMKSIPLIVVDPFWSLTAKIANVLIPSAITGIEAGGSAYRMDSVPLKLKKIVNPPEGVLSDKEILEKLLEKVEEKL